jgi:hypothetical protein
MAYASSTRPNRATPSEPMKGTARQWKDARRDRIINLLLILVFLTTIGVIGCILVRSVMKWSVPGLG